LRRMADTSIPSRGSIPPVKTIPLPAVPLAEKLRRTLEEHGAAEDAERARQQRQSQLREAARKAAPAQFATMACLLRTKGDVLNSEHLPGFPELKYVAVNHRLDAAKFAIELSPYAALDTYSVRVLIGLHPNAAQFLPELPDIPTREQRLYAAMDQD